MSVVEKAKGLGKPAAVDETITNGEEVVSKTAPMLTITTAQRARMERNRQRARELRAGRLNLWRRPGLPGPCRPYTDSLTQDRGGGFILEEDVKERPRVVSRSAPVADPAERPLCEECLQTFAQSYLFDKFEQSVCDPCRDDADAHALITRTDAKTLYLLKDCDLDERSPVLRYELRRNPHAGRGDTRLYLRLQVESRALIVWGSEELLEQERERRSEAQKQSKYKKMQKNAKRMNLSSSVINDLRPAHVHNFDAEQYDDDTETYSRTCSQCSFVESYEKM